MSSRLLLFLALPAILSAQIKIMVHLAPASSAAFEKYVTAAEAHLDAQAQTAAKPGAVDLKPVGGSPIDIEGGMIHDWVGGTLIPGASVEKALAMFQDYAAYKKNFAPEVLDSRLLGHDGDRWDAHFRIARKNIVTVTFDADYAVTYRKLEGGAWGIESRSTKISELDEDNKPLPEDTSQGFLWRLNSYWLIQPRPEGVYLECRAISLSRDIPAGLGWLIKPMISSVPRDSLRATVEEAKRALR